MTITEIPNGRDAKIDRQFDGDGDDVDLRLGIMESREEEVPIDGEGGHGASAETAQTHSVSAPGVQ